MSKLSRIVAPKLRKYGFEVQEYPPGSEHPRELRVTNPRLPGSGCVVIDREGLIEWDRWADMSSDTGAGSTADMIIGLLASGGPVTASGPRPGTRSGARSGTRSGARSSA